MTDDVGQRPNLRDSGLMPAPIGLAGVLIGALVTTGITYLAMTRVRMKHFLDIPDGEYELIRLDESGHWVVRDAGGDILTEEHDSPLKIAAVRCDFCGRWSDNAAPFAAGRWKCFGGADPCPGA